MPNGNMQPQQPNMEADQAAAALSFATILSEQMMPKTQPEEASGEEFELGEANPMQDFENSVQEEPVELEEEEVPEENIDEKYEAWMTEVGTMVDEKLEAMKNEILEAIKRGE